MNLSLTNSELVLYLRNQLNNFFPDGKNYDILEAVIKKTLEKVAYNFQHIKLSYFWKNDIVYFNHLNADQYIVFIYYASNIAFEDFKNEELASKLFYLNKTLHGFHCMYNTKLPDIFLLIHGNGIVLGKAQYSNYFVAMHGVTVGSNAKLQSPILGKNIVLYPNSSLVGAARISDETCLSHGTILFDTDTPSNSLVFGHSPDLSFKQQKVKKSQIYFYHDPKDIFE